MDNFPKPKDDFFNVIASPRNVRVGSGGAAGQGSSNTRGSATPGSTTGGGATPGGNMGQGGGLNAGTGGSGGGSSTSGSGGTGLSGIPNNVRIVPGSSAGRISSNPNLIAVNSSNGLPIGSNTAPLPVAPPVIIPTPMYGGGGGTPSGNDVGSQEQSEPEEIQETEIVDDSSDSDNDLANSTNFSGLPNGKKYSFTPTDEEIKAGGSALSSIGSAASTALKNRTTGDCTKPLLPKFMAKAKWAAYEDCMNKRNAAPSSGVKPPTGGQTLHQKSFFSTPAGMATAALIGIAVIGGGIYAYKKFIK